ncbi:armadillo-type protein, partial [Vararia minispora EC-137]
VDSRLHSLLALLVPERFNSISDEIIAWVNDAEEEKNSRTITLTVRCIIDRTIEDETSTELCARLCRKMLDDISPNIEDYSIINSEGKPYSGRMLFRKHLLNYCQGALNGQDPEDTVGTRAVDLEKKRRGLATLPLIAQLFRYGMLTERIMHETIKRLLVLPITEPACIVGLCKIFLTAGRELDHPKARRHIDVYFERMKGIVQSGDLDDETASMLKSVIALREKGWV